MNVFTTVGRICNDLELKQLGETCICEVNLAIPDRKKENGEWIEATIFTQVKVWGRIAENLVKYKSKGQEIAVTSRLGMDEWTDKDSGKKRTKLYFTAIAVDFIGSKSDNDSGNNGGVREVVQAPIQQAAAVADADSAPF
jgi:single-strand DNA-binding protein